MDTGLKKTDTLDLKDELERRGWFTEIMWHIEDMKINYNCSDADAQGVLERVFRSEHVNQIINDAIVEGVKVIKNLSYIFFLIWVLANKIAGRIIPGHNIYRTFF